MNCQSCLNDNSSVIVVDSSVIINLVASGIFAEIMDALPNRIVAVQEVKYELERGRSNGYGDAQALESAIEEGKVDLVSLGEKGQSYFVDLVSGPASVSLGDGEAATIAYAVETSACAVLDERKANRICDKRYTSLAKVSSTDLLLHENVVAEIGTSGLSDAVFSALQIAKMRVLPHHQRCILNLIGPDRAAKCSSLPKALRASSSIR